MNAQEMAEELIMFQRMVNAEPLFSKHYEDSIQICLKTHSGFCLLIPLWQLAEMDRTYFRMKLFDLVKTSIGDYLSKHELEPNGGQEHYLAGIAIGCLEETIK